MRAEYVQLPVVRSNFAINTAASKRNIHVTSAPRSIFRQGDDVGPPREVIEYIHLFQTKQAIRRLGQLNQDWDGMGSEAPTPLSRENAVEALSGFYDAATIQFPWVPPHVSASEEGEVTLEWWHRNRKLTIYFSGDEIEFVKVWGVNIYSEMDTGYFSQATDFGGAWEWLHGV